MGWTSIYQLFWCSPGVHGFDPLPYVFIHYRYYSTIGKHMPKMRLKHKANHARWGSTSPIDGPPGSSTGGKKSDPMPSVQDRLDTEAAGNRRRSGDWRMEHAWKIGNHSGKMFVVKWFLMSIKCWFWGVHGGKRWKTILTGSDIDKIRNCA